MDLSKAFDCLDHSVLLRKLAKYGVKGSPLAWLSSYLISRDQRVKSKGIYSSHKLILLGVLQSSILGPILISIYINDIFSLPTLCQYQLLLYSNDSAPCMVIL